jgi:hypothetical protein
MGVSKRIAEYPDSDAFIVWAESLSGMLTTIKTRHGGIVSLIESDGWDDSRTEYAVQLVKSLSTHLRKVEKELSHYAINSQILQRSSC